MEWWFFALVRIAMASAKRSDDQWDQLVISNKRNGLADDPMAALADCRVNMSIKASTPPSSTSAASWLPLKGRRPSVQKLLHLLDRLRDVRHLLRLLQIFSSSNHFVARYKGAMIEEVPRILKVVFLCTLEVGLSFVISYSEHIL